MVPKGKNLVELLAQFLIDNTSYYKQEQFIDIAKNLEAHYRFGTLDFEIDSNGIVYVMRYNALNEGIARVIDLAIRKDMRRKINLKYLALKNWTRFPLIRSIWYDRELKENKIPRIHSLEKFIGG